MLFNLNTYSLFQPKHFPTIFGHLTTPPPKKNPRLLWQWWQLISHMLLYKLTEKGYDPLDILPCQAPLKLLKMHKSSLAFPQHFSVTCMGKNPTGLYPITVHYGMHVIWRHWMYSALYCFWNHFYLTLKFHFHNCTNSKCITMHTVLCPKEEERNVHRMTKTKHCTAVILDRLKRLWS